MHARVVRFTDVTQEQMDRLLDRINDSGPPEGLSFRSMNLIHDPDQGTAISLQIFDSREDMEAAEEIMGGMDSSDTPGTRTSVDRGEIVGGTGEL